MAKIRGNLLLNGVSGTIGRQLTFRQIAGKTFVSKYQREPSVPATEKKRAVQKKFGLATAYARKVVKNPELKAMYQAKVKGGQRAFNIAMMDALQAPVVESIQADNYQGRPGDQIFVRATDDFKVATVIVEIFNKAGQLMERGNAILRKNEIMNWLYVARQENADWPGSMIAVMATDLPGNRSTLSTDGG